MKIETFTFLKHKFHLFSCVALMLASILFSASKAYSQVDYYYGINRTGLRVGVGVGATVLHSNWSSNPVGVAGLVNVDYDKNLYLSIGLQATYGTLSGMDAENKLAFTQTKVTFFSGAVNFKVAVGEFADFKCNNLFEDAMKRLYVGAGIGLVNSASTLTKHTDNKGLSDVSVPGLATGKTAVGTKAGTVNNTYVANNSYPVVPINFGTNISLRGVLGSDKLELNPNLQYNFVLSPLFDGYEPNTTAQSNTNIKISGNQAYFVGSLTLRYKF